MNPYQLEVQRERCSRGLSEFVKCAWHVVDPAPLVWNWHMDAICEHVEAVYRHDISHLLINVPPGHSKSLLINVFAPAWRWTWDPSWRSLFASYVDRLSLRDAVRCRDLIKSDWYQDVFQPEWDFAAAQDVKSHYKNTVGGERFSTSVRGALLGFRGDGLHIDDPMPPDEDPTEAELEAVTDWFDRKLSTRVNNPAEAEWIVIMQRLHELDLSGHILETGGWTHLCLPTEFDSENRCRTWLVPPEYDDDPAAEPWEDPREEDGELLFEALYPRDVVEKAKRPIGGLGGRGFAAQHNQKPRPDEGTIIKVDWVNHYKRPAHEVAHKCTSIGISIDCTFKAPKKGSSKKRSWVHLSCWGLMWPNFFLLDEMRGRWGFSDTLKQIRLFRRRWRRATLILIEAKANGPAVEDVLVEEFPGLVLMEPVGDKVARAEAVAPLWEAGNVWIPHESVAPWSGEWEAEVTGFPDAAADDRVDTMTQILIRWARSGGQHPYMREAGVR